MEGGKGKDGREHSVESALAEKKNVTNNLNISNKSNTDEECPIQLWNQGLLLTGHGYMAPVGCI